MVRVSVLEGRTPERLVAGAAIVTAALVLATSTWIVQSGRLAAEPDLLSLAVTLDLTLLLPGLYLLAIRRTRIPKLTVLPVLILCLLVASAILPDDRHRYLSLVELALIPLELLVAVVVVRRASRIVRGVRGREEEGDFVEALRRVARQEIGANRVADILTTEFAMFYYLVTGWRGQPEVVPGQIAFPGNRQSGYPVFASVIAMVMLVETIGVHFIVQIWSDVAAWTLTSLGLYGFVFLFGDLHAIRLRSTVVAADRVRFRLGLRWTVDVPRSEIERVQEAVALPPGLPKRERPLRLIPLGEPNLRVVLRRPHEAVGLYGVRRAVSAIDVIVDDPDGLRQALSVSGVAGH